MSYGCKFAYCCTLYTVFLIYLLYVYSGTRAHIAGVAMWFSVWGRRSALDFSRSHPSTSWTVSEMYLIGHLIDHSLSFINTFSIFCFFFRTDCLVKQLIEIVLLQTRVFVNHLCNHSSVKLILEL